MQVLIECDDHGVISKIEMLRHGQHDPIVYTHGTPAADGAVILSAVPEVATETARWAAGRLREIRTTRLRAVLTEHAAVPAAELDAVVSSLIAPAPAPVKAPAKKRR